ncbi:DUF2723 domain-containing protein [bacterium]|nr:DUF2723 domain-containing protein [bacterium]
MTETRRLRWFASLAVFLLCLIVYVLTLAPSMDFIDAGELSAVAHTWGIAHPTGYPLFTLLAGLWANLPLGDGIYRMNLFAAILSAAAAGVTVQWLYVLLTVPVKRKRGVAKKQKNAKKSASSVRSTSVTPGGMLPLAAAFAGALLLGLSGTYWRTALSIEVYPLHVFMLSLLLWRSAVLFFVPESESDTFRRRLLVLALLLGLSFGNHMSTIFLLPAFAVLLVWQHGKREGFWRDVAVAVPVFAAGLLPYLYLPLRAASDPWLNWGDPVTLNALYRHVSGAQYSVWMFSSAAAWQKQFAYAFTAFTRDMVYAGFAAAVIGAFLSWKRGAPLAAYLLLLFLTCLVWASGYDIHDIDSYFLLAFFVLAIWASFTIAELPSMVAKGMSATAGTAIVGALLVFPLLLNASRVSQAGNTLVEDYTHGVFASLQKNALIISYQWDYWVSASYYYQLVENLRPDVIVLDKELFRRSWYLEQLRNNHPALAALVKDELERFEVELAKFEEGRPYNPTMIEAAYNGLINAMIDRSYPERPVYLTIEMEKQFGEGYERVPEGLAFRLYRPEDVPPPNELFWPDLRFRNFVSDERLVPAIKELYANMISNRGIYLSQHGMYAEADARFDQALEVLPGSSAILGWKKRNAAASATAPQ